MKYLLAILVSFLSFSPAPVAVTELAVDTMASTVYWKGTKMRGLRKHEGTIRLKSGNFELADKKVIGGEFIIDMNSIKVTDIPARYSVSITNLRNHLKSDDFFAVERFPEATFKLSEVQLQADNSYDITGTLTIRGITHSIQFTASIDYLSNDKIQVKADIALDRQRWDVAFKGIRDMVVGDTMYLKLDVISL